MRAYTLAEARQPVLRPMTRASQVRQPALRVDPAIATLIVIGAVIIVSFQSFGQTAFYRDHLDGWFQGWPGAGMYPHLFWFGSSLAWLFALPLAVAALLPGRSLRDFGLGLGDWRFGMRAASLLYAAMLPVLVAVSFRDNFVAYYPMSDWVRGEVRLFADGAGTIHLASFLVYEAAYASYFVGWEFFHRGFLTIGLEPVLGWYAVLVVSIPFAVMHVGKPMPEAYGAIVASLVLGWLALRTRSSWYGFGLHAAVAVTMDVLAVLHIVA
jgi:membrane protease YdiL (CAAX protease family)